MDIPPTLISGPAAEATPVRGPDAEAADRLYKTVEKAPLPGGLSPAERLFPPGAKAANGSTTYGPDTRTDGKPAITTDVKANPAEALAATLNPAGSTSELKAHAAELAIACATAGLDRHDLANLVRGAEHNVTSPPTDDEQRAYKRLALKELRTAYPGNFDQAFQAAKDLVKATPALRKALDQSHLGNDPGTVLRLAELGMLAKAKGRL